MQNVRFGICYLFRDSLAPLAVLGFQAKDGGGRRVTLPLGACLQGRCITFLPRPHDKMASRPGAAPGRLSFGNSAAQAGARLIGKLKGPGAFMLPARAISTKNKHLLAIYSIPARGFTAAVSVFRGTPPAKPFNCKIWSKRPDARFGDQW